MVKNISIFCGAHEGKNPTYALDAKKIAALLSKKGVDVVFGGGNVGIMKIISDEAKDNNSKVTGITMESLHNLELTNCLLYTSPSPRDLSTSRMPSSA